MARDIWLCPQGNSDDIRYSLIGENGKRLAYVDAAGEAHVNPSLSVDALREGLRRQIKSAAETEQAWRTAAADGPIVSPCPREQHKSRHAELHAALDELVAEWIRHTPCLPSQSSVLSLMEWSSKQVDCPTEEPDTTVLPSPAP